MDAHRKKICFQFVAMRLQFKKLGVHFLPIGSHRKKIARHSDEMAGHRKIRGGYYADSKHPEALAGSPCDQRGS